MCLYAAVLADRDLLDLILRASRPDEDSLLRLRVVLSGVSWTWRAAARQARFDAAWLRPFAASAARFVRTLPALQAAGDVPALLAGIDAFRSSAATQQAAVDALNGLLRGPRVRHVRTAMRVSRGFARLVASLRAHLCHDSPCQTDRHCSRMAAHACLDVLKRAICSDGVPHAGRAAEAASAGVFAVAVRVIQKNMAFRAMVCAGLSVLRAGARHAGAAGMHVAMEAMRRYADSRRSADTTVQCAGMRVLAGLQIAAGPAGLLACVRTVSPLHLAFVAAGGVELVLATLRRPAPLACFERAHALSEPADAPCARCVRAVARMRLHACLALAQVAAQHRTDTARSIVDGGGVAAVVRLLRQTGTSSGTDVATQLLGCLALVHLARMDAALPQRVLAEKGLPVLERALAALPTDSEHAAAARDTCVPVLLARMQQLALADPCQQ